MIYDPQRVRTYFDTFGDKEWARLEDTLQGRIKYAVHRHILDAHDVDGQRLLDVGCGPGRFALDLARRGACLTLADLSQTQLNLAREQFKTAGLLNNVDAFHCLDLVDMAVFPNDQFDAVVCYGATLSYTYTRYKEALSELVRVLRPGGLLFLSVCSLYGTMRLLGPLDAHTFLEQADEHVEWAAVLRHGGVVYTRPDSPEFHQALAMFSSEGLRTCLSQVGFEPHLMASSNPMLQAGNKIPRITDSDQASSTLTELEIALCTCPGLVDTGEHLIAVAGKLPVDD